MNELINDTAVCRTAPATPGLLNTVNYENRFQYIGYIPENEQIWLTLYITATLQTPKPLFTPLLLFPLRRVVAIIFDVSLLYYLVYIC